MPIFISSTPTIEKDDLRLARKLLITKDVPSTDVKLPGFESKKHFFTNTGRASLYIILKALRIRKNKEVIVQSFTCVALVTPLIWLGIKPIYTDIDPETFNMSLESLKKKITDKTRAVIIQHTFGIPSEVVKIKKYLNKINKTREKKIYLIEDCAHSLNVKLDDKYLGSFGDVSFFSFGQDKVVSCTQGGCIISNNEEIEERIKRIYRRVHIMYKKDIRYNLRYPILWNIIKKIYDKPKFIYNSRFSLFTFGKFLVILFRFFGLIKPQASISNFGDPKKDVCKLSYQQKHLLKNQLNKIDVFTDHREKITSQYSKLLELSFKGPLLRYPVLVDNPEYVRLELQKIGVVAGNWYNYPVIPKGIDFKRISYHLGSCINTEYLMEHIINLPTGMDVNDKDVKKISKIVKEHLL
ncbi:MAG: DegT/DnrJ/EryC1/StrS family aminotransferase [Candidatus Dojkabacteria bacterium]|nr:DegT/DnrJ/EryC1/StrS family aminotransferase [Candidatus Dojkabacteria bacterium]